MGRLCGAALCLMAASVLVANTVFAQEYRFQRYFPTLQQPWYFASVQGDSLAITLDDQILVGSLDLGALFVMNRSGQVTKLIGSAGSGFGQFMGIDGVAVDPNGRILTIDRVLSRLSVFSNSGEFVESQSLPLSPNESEIAIDPLGNIYIAFCGGSGPYIQSLTSGFSLRFFTGTSGDGGITISCLGDIAYDQATDSIFVLEDRSVLRYDASDGMFLNAWSISAPARARAVTVYQDEILLATDAEIGAVRRFDRQGNYLGDLPLPGARFISRFAHLHDQLVVLSEPVHSTVQVYSSSQQLLTTIKAAGDGVGQFNQPAGVAFDSLGRLHVVDSENERIQRFDAGQASVVLQSPALRGNGSIAIDSAGNIALISAQNIEQYDAAGNFLTSWSPVNVPLGETGDQIAFDGSDRLFHFIDTATTDMLQIYEPGAMGLGFPYDFVREFPLTGVISSLSVAADGTTYYKKLPERAVVRVDEFGTELSTTPIPDPYAASFPFARLSSGRFLSARQPPSGPTPDTATLAVVDDAGNIDHIFGGVGIGPGQLTSNIQIAVGPNDEIAISDRTYHRVTVFSSVAPATESRAIVVSAGGPFPGNVLWPATQVNANLAVRTLNFQGFDKGTTQYLSSDLDLDLDQNGLADDVDLDATNANLMESILGPGGQGLDGFAGDAGVEELIIYLVDHGGQDQFRMSGTQTLPASDLDTWLDTWQTAHPTAQVRVIYDACQSGSFMSTLAGANRTIITSASGSENAHFVSQGTLSFSNFFWTHVFNGLDLRDSFSLAQQSTQESFDNQQNPLIDVDGDGVTNEPVDDIDALMNVFIGNGTDTFSSRPVIGSLTATPQTIADGNTSTLTAMGVTDPDGIARVWAVLRPPGFNPGSPDNPVSDLPTVDLLPIGGDTFEVAYDGFSTVGTYQVTLNALDAIGNTAVPLVTTVTVQNPLKRRSVVIVGDQNTDTNYPAFELNGTLAVAALKQQGYGPDGTDCTNALCDDIKFYVDTGLADTDGTAVLSNIQFAIEQWGADENQDMVADVQDLTVYIVGEPEAGGIRLTNNEVLTPTLLDGYLATAEAIIPGTLTLVVDGDDAGGFVSQLTPSAKRITVASAGSGETARFFDGGSISFSQFFWGLTLNGATVNQSFGVARQAINFGPNSQSPELDDTGNGIPNELFDGLLANRYSIGTGVLLAGDAPVIGIITAPAVVVGDSAGVTVSGVTSTSAVAQVSLVVSRDDGTVEVLAMADQGGGVYQTTVVGFLDSSAVVLSAYAEDTDGSVSLPATTTSLGDVILRTGFE